jgi:alcohol dehydrogenase (NADP+)
MKTLNFRNNDQMPAIGLGTWKATGEEVKKAVKEALIAGFRHIDTATIYQNEIEIGQALKEVFDEGEIKREDVFITSKLWNDAHGEGEVIPALQESLKRLQLDYLDLYLVHWPVSFVSGVLFPQKASEYIPTEKSPIVTAWNQMEQVKNRGLARHIGVSNFSVKKLKDLISKANTKPELNQVELHPLLQQNALINFCSDQDILVTSYSPLGSGDRTPEMKAENEPNLMGLEILANIAKKHEISSAQVLISWHLHRNCSVIPKSSSTNHIEANYQAHQVVLDEADMQSIALLDKNYRFITGKFFEMPGSGYTNIFDE